jgi:hypothetical protein
MDNINLPDDKALLKIVNRNDNFYLESATYVHHSSDLAEAGINKEAIS